MLELNEINFEALEAYSSTGRLPNLGPWLAEPGYSLTFSERKYEELEPWIQWVTAHTGLPLAEHGVFRLGDIVDRDLPQIWEQLEDLGLKVGAISPMNAENRTKNAAFFVPDPWTPARLTAGSLLKKLYGAISQAVNDNAQARLTVGSIVWLLMGAAAYARPVNYGQYLSLFRYSRSKPWAKAMFLDQLLADVFVRETRRADPNFATLFLNAGAHVQHHYMFSSAAYDGPQKNPDWYVADGLDPVLEVYQLYDRIVGQVRKAFPDARLMIATGLHQEPHPKLTYYWRLKDHVAFLRRLSVPFVRVEPRMSRDFLITCASADDAMRTATALASARAEDGVELFEVDNRGTDIFAMLTYPHEIGDDEAYTVGNRRFEGLGGDVAFVALKNGQHNGTGYFIDTGAPKGAHPPEFPLAELPQKVKAALTS